MSIGYVFVGSFSTAVDLKQTVIPTPSSPCSEATDENVDQLVVRASRMLHLSNGSRNLQHSSLSRRVCRTCYLSLR